MKSCNHEVRLDIDLPVDKVIQLFDDPDNLKEWQNGLVRLEISAEPLERRG